MKILMIALDYHRYSQAIEDEFRAAGHQVKRYPIVPATLHAWALRLNEPAYWRHVARYHQQILERERRNGYDWVFFLQCHQFTRENMEAYRHAFANARLTLYNWDSILTHDYRPLRDLFDDIFTFDPDDAAAEGLHYLPLFCIRDFQRIRHGRGSAPGVYVVGNIASPNRYLMVDAFRDHCAQANIPLQAFLRAGPLTYVKLLRKIGFMRGVSLTSIEHDAFVRMMASSSATFDFANHQQSGMTMRVVENLCGGLKIITNNARIMNEPFYSPDRFHIYSGQDFSGVAEFLNVPLRDPEADFPEYHVQTFARHLMAGTGHMMNAPAERQSAAG